MKLLTTGELASVFEVARHSESHSIWRNKHGAVITQCGKVAISEGGLMRSGWTASYTRSDGMGRELASSCVNCRACRRAM